jgi:hypothetical protein
MFCWKTNSFFYKDVKLEVRASPGKKPACVRKILAIKEKTSFLVDKENQLDVTFVFLISVFLNSCIAFACLAFVNLM